MKRMIFLLPFLMTSTMMAQSFSAFVGFLNTLPEAERQAEVDAFITAVSPQGFPYINYDTASFIYLGNISGAAVAGDFNGWNPAGGAMSMVQGTNMWYRQEIFELNARLDYKFVLNGNYWILDPLNPSQVSGGYGPNSELSMPSYVQPWEINVYGGTPAGTLETFPVFSGQVGEEYDVAVYLPHGYDPERAGGYPTAYFHDGEEYLGLGSAKVVLDNIIHSGDLDTVIVVFIKPNDRMQEYAGNLRDQYRLFIVDELRPYIDQHYNTADDPGSRAVCGTSLGGNIATLISYNHPDVFGLCGLHSAAFQLNGYEAFNLVVNGEYRDISWAMVWGTYEGLYPNLREFRDFLVANAYQLHWQELPEGHSWGLWRATIDELLTAFFPGPEFGIRETESILGTLVVAPNPFPGHTSVSFYLAESADLKVTVFDQMGRMVWEHFYPLLKAGRHHVHIDLTREGPGVYICQLATYADTISVKIIRE